MKISIIHPSRNRSQQAFTTRVNWYTNADDALSHEYILSIDSDDRFVGNYCYNFPYSNGKIVINNNKSAIEAINRAAEEACGDVLVVISDDFICEEHWDTKLLKALEGKFDFLVKTRDGLQKTLITLPIMDRAYYDRFGYIYNPDYQHMFVDQEMTAVGHMLGRVIDVDMTFEHLHYTTGKSPKDAINVRNDNSWRQGENLFNERLKINFGIAEPVMKYEDIVWI